MNLMLNAKDISKLSASTRAELMALVFPRDDSEIPSGFDEDDFEDVVDLESAYIAEWSVARDAIILARTLPAVIRMDGAL